MSKTFFNSKQKILDSGIRTTFTGVLHVYHKSQLGITNTEIRLPHGLSLAAILTSAVACTVCRLPCLYRTAAEPSPRSLSESLVFSRQIVIRLNVIQNNKTKLTKTMSTYTLEKKAACMNCPYELGWGEWLTPRNPMQKSPPPSGSGVTAPTICSTINGGSLLVKLVTYLNYTTDGMLYGHSRSWLVFWKNSLFNT